MISPETGLVPVVYIVAAEMVKPGVIEISPIVEEKIKDTIIKIEIGLFLVTIFGLKKLEINLFIIGSP
jgi:hypothetical protein